MNGLDKTAEFLCRDDRDIFCSPAMNDDRLSGTSGLVEKLFEIGPGVGIGRFDSHRDLRDSTYGNAVPDISAPTAAGTQPNARPPRAAKVTNDLDECPSHVEAGANRWTGGCSPWDRDRDRWDEWLSRVGRRREPLGRAPVPRGTRARTVGTCARPTWDGGANHWDVRLSHVGRGGEPLR